MPLVRWPTLTRLTNSSIETLGPIIGAPPVQPPKPPAAPQKQPTLKPLPTLPEYRPYIANLGDSQATIQAGMASNDRQYAASLAASRAIQAQLAENARKLAAEQERIRREAEERERKRREKQAALDKVHGDLLTDRKQRAKKALDFLTSKGAGKDWRELFDESGNLKDFGYKDGDFQIPLEWLRLDDRGAALYDQWKNWYDSDDGAYRRAHDRAKKYANGLIDEKEFAGVDNNDKWGSFFDKLTFGGTRRAMGSREEAAGAYQDVMNQGTKDFEAMISAYEKKKAKYTQETEASKFTSWEEYSKAVDKANEDLKKDALRLMDMYGWYEGLAETYQARANAKIDNLPGKVGNWLNDNIVKGVPGQIFGGLWKYTLGQGDENIPSLVTLPSRAVNAAQNIFRGGDYEVVDKDGNRRKATGNPWTDSFNQSNFNAEYAATSYETYVQNKYKEAKDRAARGGSALPTVQETFGTQPLPGEKKFAPVYDKAEFEKWERENRGKLQSEWKSSEERAKGTYLFANDIAGDPLSYAGFAGKAPGLIGKIGKGVGTGFTKAAEALKGTKVGGKFFDAAQIVKDSKFVKWATAEAKTPQQAYADAVAEANKMTDKAQQKVLPKARAYAARMAKDQGELAGKFDDSVIDELRALAEAGDDQAAEWLQTMRYGDFSAGAKIRNWGRFGLNPRLTNLRPLAEKWGEFAEKMKMADVVTGSRFGTGQKRSFYSPRTRYVDPDEYQAGGFRAFKKNTAPQSAEDLYRGAVDRYLASDVIDWWGAGVKGRISKSDKELQAALGEYDDLMGTARDSVTAAWKKTRTPYGRFRGFMSKFGPTALWKKSVLKYRPAWYVNNALYNTQAAGLAGGAEAVVEQLKQLRPRYYKKALAEVPEDVRTKVANEIGSDPLSKFGNYVENTSRVASYRTLIKQGYSHDEALKRTNRYLFDYSYKNYERPLRAVLPFYSFQKGLAKAAVSMPYDRPLAAIAYNRLDREQRKSFDRDFDSVVSDLKELGYSDEEIEQIRNENRKYYEGKLKIGDRYYNTPFNAFSEKGGFGGGGISPWISSFAEISSAEDAFGRPLSGEAANLPRRLISKFPQAELGRRLKEKFDVDTGRFSPSEKWIGKPGSGGYGMTKEAQGYDPTMRNYKRSLDPRAGLEDDLLAFAGVPRSTTFDKGTLVDRKRLQKLTEEYFGKDWDSMEYEDEQAQKEALFKKYGMTADEFYDGELSKYDTPFTQQIKQQKEDAYNKTKALFEEYGRQPMGTRNVWATNKLKELVDSGYFESNSFLKSFDWTNPDTIQKAYKKMAYDYAKSTGDWSGYNAKYGMSPKAQRAAFWGEYYAETDEAKRRQMLRDNPQYAKRPPKSEAEIAEAKFWAKYAAADRETRRQLIADNPQYNKRGNWTDEQWDEWRVQRSADMRTRARGLKGFRELYEENLAENQIKAAPVLARPKRSQKIRLAFKI